MNTLASNGKNTNDSLMTVHEVATYLSLSEATVYRWAKAQKIPAMKIRQVWRFKKSEIDAWITKRQAEIRLDR